MEAKYIWSKFARSRLYRVWSESSDAIPAPGSSLQMLEGCRHESIGASSVEIVVPFINEKKKYPKIEKNKRPFS